MLSELGTWVNSYRPTKIRVTVYSATSQTVNMLLYDSIWGDLASWEQTINGQQVVEANITFGSNDIGVLYHISDMDNPISIRNIEFE